METLFIFLAGVAGFAGVAAGASGAHGMADAASAQLMETASRFLIAHAVALLALTGHLRQERSVQASSYGLLTIAGGLFAIGMLLFGGGLIFHAMTGRTTIVALVPVGGTALMAAWLAVATYGAGRVVRRRR